MIENKKKQPLIARVMHSRAFNVVIIAVVMCVPLLYAGSLTLTYHDPESLADNIHAAVVNLDSKASGTDVAGEKVSINLGDKIADKLLKHEEKTGFTWEKSSEGKAYQGLSDGKYGAILIIPKNLSSALIKQATDPSNKVPTPQLKLLSDDGVSYIAGTMTETIGYDLEKRLRADVTRELTGHVFGAINSAGGKLQQAADGAKQLATGTGKLADGVSKLDNGINSAKQGAGQLANGNHQIAVGANQLAGGAQKLQGGVNQLNTGAKKLAGGIEQLQNGANQLAGGAGNLKAGADQLSGGSGQLLAASGQLTAGAQKLAGGTGKLKAGADQLSGGLAQLNQALKASLPGIAYGQLAPKLQALQAGAAQLSGGLEQVAGGAGNLNNGLNQLHAGIQKADAAAKQVAGGAEKLQGGANQLSGGAGQLVSGAGQLTAGTSKLVGGVNRLATGSTQLSEAANQASTGAQSLKTGLDKLSTGASELQEGANSAKSGAQELADGLNQGTSSLSSLNDSSKDNLSDQAATPLQVDMIRQHKVANNGAGFAPFFLSLALWIGGISVFFIFPALDVRRRGDKWWSCAVRALNASLFMGIGQALVLGLVIAPLVGLPNSRLPELLGLLAFTGITFVAVNQALLALFGFRGRFFSVLLLVFQIAAMGATFPIQTAPGFMRAIHPFLPMTYTSRALRTIIAGHGLAVWPSIVVAAVVLIVSLAIIVTTSWVTRREGIPAGVDPTTPYTAPGSKGLLSRIFPYSVLN